MRNASRKQQEKREKIIMSAIAIMNREGFRYTTMEQVASEMQMTKGSLYYYFRNKQDLMFQCHELVLDQAIEDQKEAFKAEGAYGDKLRRMIHCHIDYAVNRKETFNMIIQPEQAFEKGQLPSIVEKRDDYARLFDRVVSEGIGAGEFKNSDVKIIRMILLGAMNWVQTWYRKEGLIGLDELKDLYAEYLLKLLK
ncbi:MAG: TetR family transcriptional regulator [Bhargavaea sp.]